MPRADCPQHDERCWGCGWPLRRCSRCGGCYMCEHASVFKGGRTWVWVCRDGEERPAICEPCGCSAREEQERQQAELLARLKRPNALPVPTLGKDGDWPF
jgi:hypothetical protein